MEAGGRREKPGRPTPAPTRSAPALQIRKHIDPLTGCLRYRTPRGRFVHVPPQLPRSDWANDFGKPWWQGSQYEVGRLSPKTRNIRIINTLTSQEHTLEVRGAAGRQAGVCFPEHLGILGVFALRGSCRCLWAATRVLTSLPGPS